MHLRIISAQSDNSADRILKFVYVRQIFCKEKHFFFAITIWLHFERLLNYIKSRK